MAAHIATANGNLTAAATWGVVDATSLLYDVTASTVLTTSYVESSAFTPGAIEVDGIAVYLTARVESPTGTISCRLAQGGALVAGTEVTINVEDVARVQTTTGTFNSQSLVFFKFAAPVTLAAATAYTVSLKTSSATQISAQRNGTANNWSRMLRTTTTGAPGAGDTMFVLGEWTAAGTKTDRTVTMDETATTDYGSASTNKSLPSIGISKGGTLTWGTTAATNYLLKLSGSIRIWPHGQMSIGTVGTPIPADSTATLQFDCAADNDFTITVDGGGGKGLTVRGSPRSAGKNVVQCKLNTDEAAGQTVLGVDTDTGWKAGDLVWITSTTRTVSQTEQRTLANDAGASSIEVTVALGSAHSGTSPTQAHVTLVTHNVVIRPTTPLTGQTALLVMADATIDMQWVEFLGVGSATQTGVEFRTGPSGSATLQYFSIESFETRAFVAGQSADWSNVNVSDGAIAASVAASITDAFLLQATTGTNNNFSRITLPIVDGNAGSQNGFTIQGGVYNLTDLVVSSAIADGFTFSGTQYGTITGIHAHSNGSEGLIISASFFGVLNDVNVWRNAGVGAAIASATTLWINGGAFFGNTTRNLSFTGDVLLFHAKGLTVAGDTSFAVSEGLQLATSGGVHARIVFENCSFGPTSGIFVPHTSEDIDLNSQGVHLVLIDTTLASTTELANHTNLPGISSISYQRHEGVTNIHRVHQPQLGTRSYETTTTRTASPSQKLAPSGAAGSLRFESSPFRVRANSGSTVSVAVYVRKDASYSGEAPRLMLRANAALGVDSDTLMDTFSSPINTWEQLTGTTPSPTEDGVFEFYIDVTGTGGAVYVDDWSAN